MRIHKLTDNSLPLLMIIIIVGCTYLLQQVGVSPAASMMIMAQILSWGVIYCIFSPRQETQTNRDSQIS